MRANPVSQQAAYPHSGYATPSFPQLSDRAERRHLSPPALRAFLRVVEHWKVRDEDARALLNGVANGTFYAWKSAGVKELDQDRLLRISYLIGIFKALNILFSPPLADRWVHLPNANPLFGHQTPLAYMLRGGLPAMATVRRLLDARRGG